MKSRSIILAVSVLGVVLLAFSAVGMVFSEYNNDDGVIRGAYNTKTGSLRIMTETDGSLKNNEVQIEWNKEGPQGPQGEQGPEGPPGQAINEADLAEMVAGLVAAEMADLIAANVALAERVLILEQEIGLAPKDAVVSSVVPYYLTVSYGTQLEELVTKLPTEVQIELDGETTGIAQVEWDLDSFSYASSGTYMVYGSLVLAEGVTNPQGLQAIAYVTVPANLWLNVERTWQDEIPDWVYGYVLEVSNLPANTQLIIEIVRGYQQPSSGSTIHNWGPYSSDNSGALRVDIQASHGVKPEDVVRIVQHLGEGFYSSHGELRIPDLSISEMTNAIAYGDLILPAQGWTEDSYEITLTVLDGKSVKVWQTSHDADWGVWVVELEDIIHPGLQGTVAIEHEHGGGIRTAWQIPACEWTGAVSGHMVVAVDDSTSLNLRVSGHLEATLQSYLWRSPSYTYGLASGSATGSVELWYDDNDERYDAWDITGQYGALSDSVLTMGGDILRDGSDAGYFDIFLTRGEVTWSGNGDIRGLPDYDPGDSFSFYWEGTRTVD